MNTSNENLKQQEVRDELNLPCTFQQRRPQQATQHSAQHHTHHSIICYILTLTKPYLTLTPHPTNVMPLHNRGNKMPVFGSVAGESIVGSAPSRGATEHSEASFFLALVVVV
eukprot:scaffold36769_cov216-Skeletonema_dohrnii-CCMP3373.AAC.1